MSDYRDEEIEYQRQKVNRIQSELIKVRENKEVSDLREPNDDHVNKYLNDRFSTDVPHLSTNGKLELLRKSLTEIANHKGCVAVIRRIASKALDEVEG